MNRTICIWVIVLLLCSTIVTLHGCARSKPPPEIKTQDYIQKIREAVSESVSDPSRREQLLELAEQMERVVEGFNADLSSFVDKYRQLNPDFYASRETFEELFIDFQTKRSRAQERIFDLHFEAKALATKDEWDKIVKYEKKTIKEMLRPREQEE